MYGLKQFLNTLICCVLIFLCAACMRLPAEEYAQEDFQLGDDIIISGIDVSRMTLGEARRQLKVMEQEWLDNTSVQLICADRAAAVRLSDLSVISNMDEVLQKAAHLNRYNGIGRPSREFELQWKLTKSQSAIISLEAAAVFNTQPQDARVVLDKTQSALFAFEADRQGISVDIDAFQRQLDGKILRSDDLIWQIPYEQISADYTLEQAKAEHQLISTFTTSFHQSPYNAKGRVFNIVKAAGLLDGVVVKAGGELNVNQVLGDRNQENGWDQAPGIRDGKYELEYGGGVCQVSTTLFNAAMLADLEITERHPHSWPVGYIDIGRDATISTGGPNLRISNSSGAPITVVTNVDEEADTLTVSLYGRPLAGGKSIEIQSEQTAMLPKLKTEYILDTTLSDGTRVVDREGRAGKKSVTYKIYYDAEGNLLEKKIAYNDTYRSVRKRVLVASDLYYLAAFSIW